MLILSAIIVLACSAVGLASWGITSLIKGGGKAPAGKAATSTSARVTAEAPTAAQTAEHQGRETTAAAEGGEARQAAATPTGETFSYENIDQRYVTETQRHQNFLKALGEGRVRRLDMTATDFQPAGDPDSSYVYVIISTTDNNRYDGTIVMRYTAGMWRIGAVRLSGALAGGTNYNVPSSFEADLERALDEQQPFLTKVAEGRLGYMSIDSVNRVSEGETVLTGEVASKAGSTFPATMTLKKDFCIWHITSVVCL